MFLLQVNSTIEFCYEGQPYAYRVPQGFSIGSGERVCISGVSGSGKSTMLTMLAGLRRLAQGEIYYRFPGREFRLTAEKWDAGPELWGYIGFGFQRPELLNALSAASNLRLTLGPHVEQIGQRLFPKTERVVNGEHQRNNEWLEIKHKQATKLSGGQKLRIGLARAFGIGQSFVILDEPTAALDQDNRKVVAEFIREQSRGTGLLIVAHDAEFVAMLDVDRVYEIDQFEEDGPKDKRKVRSLKLLTGS